MARSNNSGYVVLECKGTQRSRAFLGRSIATGRRQKAALEAKNADIQHSLVAGLFISQWGSVEGSCLRIADPYPKDLGGILSKQSKEGIAGAITQVALAKQLALAGVKGLPDYLVSERFDKLPEMPTPIRRELESLSMAEHRVVFDSVGLWPHASREARIVRIKFSVAAPDVEGAILVKDVGALVDRASTEWKIETSESAAEVKTPLGFRFKLQVDLGESFRLDN
jgi:hypothetical protein